MSSARRPIIFNENAKDWRTPPSESADAAFAFHQRHFNYQPTKLIALPNIAADIGVKQVYVKSEVSRFDLPSFKILGASWGVFRCLAARLNLPLTATLQDIKTALDGSHYTLYAATDGNHGRAVARMASILGMSAEIHVPYGLSSAAIASIESEGAQVVVSQGNYDVSISDADKASQYSYGLLIQDYAFGDYLDVPQWIVDGYQTMMREIDDQLGGESASLVIAPAGVGSFAQAVTSYFKQQGKDTAVVCVEPDTAACIWKSFQHGELISKVNTPTIMAGLDCGTPSKIAWPVLRHGVDATITISDFEAHLACKRLADLDVPVGPCGAAALAALLRMGDEDKVHLGLNGDSTVVLMCTEGARDYAIPHDVGSDSATELANTLVQLENMVGQPEDAGGNESHVSRFISHWLEHRDIDTHYIDIVNRRPPLVDVPPGARRTSATLCPLVQRGLDGSNQYEKEYSNDEGIPPRMKSGLAAAMIATAVAKQATRGNVKLCARLQEEYN